MSRVRLPSPAFVDPRGLDATGADKRRHGRELRGVGPEGRGVGHGAVCGLERTPVVRRGRELVQALVQAGGQGVDLKTIEFDRLDWANLAKYGDPGSARYANDPCAACPQRCGDALVNISWEVNHEACRESYLRSSGGGGALVLSGSMLTLLAPADEPAPDPVRSLVV